MPKHCTCAVGLLWEVALLGGEQMGQLQTESCPEHDRPQRRPQSRPSCHVNPCLSL